MVTLGGRSKAENRSASDGDSRHWASVLDGHAVNRRSSSLFSLASFFVALGLVSVVPSTAHADVSSWLSLGAGMSQLRHVGFDRDLKPSLRMGFGMGTDPSHSFVVGGLLRTDTLFGSGTDLSLSMRLATHGFANGKWGVAVDAGPLARYWGHTEYGATTAVVVGAPWGLELGLQAALGREALRTYGAFLAIDLARLTVYRRSGSSYWKNSFPAYRTPSEEQH